MLKIYQEKPYAPHKIGRKDIFQNPTFIPDKRSQRTRIWSDLLLHDQKKKNLWVKIRQNDKWLNVFLLKSQYKKGACSHHIYSSMYWILASAVKQEKENKHLIWKKSIKMCQDTYIIICVDNPMESTKNLLEQVIIFGDVV